MARTVKYDSLLISVSKAFLGKMLIVCSFAIPALEKVCAEAESEQVSIFH